MSSLTNRIRRRSTDLVGHWTLKEESGAVAEDHSTNGYNATSSGLLRSNFDRSFLGPDGAKCAKFDGSASYIDLYAAQATAPTTIGTISIWAAVPQANLIGTTMMQIIKLGADGNNYIDITFDTTARRFNGAFKAGGTLKSVNSDLVYNEPQSIRHGARWLHFAITWTKAGEELKFYLGGVQQGSTQSSLGTWSGSFASDLMVLGSSNTTPADQFTGWMSNLAMWTAVQPESDIKILAKEGL